MAEIAAFYPVPSIPMFGICPFVLKHWIFKKNSKLHVHVLSKNPPKQQGHLMNVMLEQTNTGYMYDLAIDFIMCNIVPDSEFVLACMVIIVM